MTFSIFIFLLTISFAMTICQAKLTYNTNLNSISKINRNIGKTFPLLTSYTNLCLISEEDELLTNVISNYNTENKTITLLMVGETCAFCDAVIVIEFNVTKICKTLKINSNERLLYFFNYHIKLDLEALEKCLDYNTSTEVISVSLASGNLMKLHSDFSETPKFKRTTTEDILIDRLKIKKTNLKGRKINVAFDPNPPYVIVNKYQNGTDKIDGIEFRTLTELSHRLNFTMELIPYANWGSLTSKGKWMGENGVIPALERGDAELALSVVWFISTIYASVDFPPSLNRLKLSFIVRRPEQVEFQWKYLLTIFQPTVWMIILVLYTFVIVMYKIGINKLRKQHKPCWSECLLTTLGLTIQTSFPRRKIARFVGYVLTSWSFFSLLLTTILSGNIFCSLTLPQYSERVDTVDQLVKNHYYWTIPYYIRFNNSAFKTDIFNFHNPVVNKFEKTYRYMSNEQLSVQVKFDKKVTILTESFGNDLVFIDAKGLQGHPALKDFRQMDEAVASLHFSFGIAKHSPLLEPITVMTLRFIEAGLMHQWKDQVLRDWPIYDTRHLTIETDITSFFSDPQALSLNKLQPVFYLLLFGFTIACVVFAIEYFW